MGVKTIADRRIVLWALTKRPANLKAPTVAEIKAGKKVSCGIMKSDYKLGATGSQTITESELCKGGEGKGFGPTQYEGSVTPFAYLNEQGLVDEDDPQNDAWRLFGTKGTTLWLVEREGPYEYEAPAENQPVAVYEVVTDAAQKPNERHSGYVKRIVSLAVEDAEEHAKIAA